MAHFAELNSDNKVIGVFKVENAVITDENNQEQESLGIDFLKGLFGSDKIYKQTSYNNTIRKNYARLGDTYDSVRDAFISDKPYNSWVLNEETCRYESPVPHPDPKGLESGFIYNWNEETVAWVKEVYNEG
tara:strand:- start:140 stop:532 length:393 start_codon:yes stop_codon:yes gene_type:complete